MKIKIFFLVFLLFILALVKPVFAYDCPNRFLTLVNPIRGRNLWIDKTLASIRNQYALISRYNFPATWLIQYDVLQERELVDEIKKFDNNQELGVFLEVSEKLANQSRVIYPHGTYWFNPKAVFLSGYSRSDRRKLIDKLFNEFKEEFKFYPKSLGAWWIDSYSLDYMKARYGIKAAMIVADQRTTDNYGVWGQWWGLPYYPSKINILTPASSLNNKLDVVITQWAQRDPNLAYGEGPQMSNYSLQANDYIRQGKDIEYFKNLVNIYLDCKNPVGQITVGLETGIESIGYIDEYGKQLKVLSQLKDLNVVTMSQFANEFSKSFPVNPKQLFLGDWILNTDSRSNEKLGDYIKYQQGIAFKDYFITDKEDFLDRNLEKLNKKKSSYFPFYLILIITIGVIFKNINLFNIWIIGTLFIATTFGLILKSNYQHGWEVFYGPKIAYLILIQIIITLLSFLLIWFISNIKFIQKNKLILWFIPLSFGFDFIIRLLRFSYFGGKYYFGIALDSLRFFGFSFAQPFKLEFIDKDFSSVVSVSLLRFDFSKIWDNLYLSLIAYPLIHILLALILGYLVAKLPLKVRKIIIGIFIILLGFQLIHIFQADPRLVQ